MDAIGQYVVSITAAAIICAVLTHISACSGKNQPMLKLICGLFLTFTVIRPVADIQLDTLSNFTVGFAEDAQEAVSRGENYAHDSLQSIIKQETEAYILDKAAAMGAQIRVEIIVTDDAQPVPEEIYIHGTISPDVKRMLQTLITEDIGIAKEYQIWIQ